MTAARRPVQKPVKVTDEAALIRCTAGDGLIREEVWKDAEGKVIRFNLAFINFHLFSGDNGRVLGYDSAHGYPHRHYAGSIEAVEPVDYDLIFDRFLAEVELLKSRSCL
jgi:hypothetical protein